MNETKLNIKEIKALKELVDFEMARLGDDPLHAKKKPVLLRLQMLNQLRTKLVRLQHNLIRGARNDI